MKRQWTDEERRAFGVKMKLSRNKKNLNNETENVVEKSPSNVVLTQEQFDALMNRLAAVEKTPTQPVKAQEQVARLDYNNRVVGVVPKYGYDSSLYHSPIDRLMNIKELERFAFRENHFLTWSPVEVEYENKAGINMSEQRFELKLLKRLFEDDGTPTPLLDTDGKQMYDAKDEPLHKSYLVSRLFYFEDPAAARTAARSLGIDVTESNSIEFLEEMRYLFCKDWLMERFQVRRPSSTPRSTSTMLIGSTQVEVESYSEIV